MRHFLALPLLASRVRESAVTARLVLPARMPQRLGSRCPTTASRAVPIAAIASRADEKTLLTFEPATDNESKRVHVPRGPTLEKLDTPTRPCHDTIVGHVPAWIDTRDSEVRTPGPSLSASQPPFAIPPRSPPRILPPSDLGDLRGSFSQPWMPSRGPRHLDRPHKCKLDAPAHPNCDQKPSMFQCSSAS